MSVSAGRAWRRWLVALRDALRCGVGYMEFRWSGKRRPAAIRGLRGLFTADPDLPRRISRLTSFVRPPRSRLPALGALGVVDRAARDNALRALRTDGFYVFPARVDQSLVDALLALGHELPRHASLDGDAEPPLFDPEHLVSSRYLCRQEDLVNATVVQSMIADRSLAAVADAYLGCDSVQCDVGLWQSVVFGSEARSAASQLFHSDRDHLQFVKFFVYLTDVDEDSGPHVFVRGSHRKRPQFLRRDVRYTDDDIAAHYSSGDVVELVGPRGTIIAADTSGLHKGKPPEAGERWIIELEYSSSLFGPGGLPMRVRHASDDFRAAMTSNPRRLSRFALTRPL